MAHVSRMLLAGIVLALPTFLLAADPPGGTYKLVLGGGRSFVLIKIESKDGKLSIETTQHSILTTGAATHEVIIRAQLEPTTENMAGWAALVTDAEMPGWIEASKKKAAK